MNYWRSKPYTEIVEMRRMILSGLCAISGSISIAQELKSVEVIFDVIRNKDGNLNFIERNTSEEIKIFSENKDFYEALEEMKGRPSTGWAVSDASGRIQNVFIADADQKIPPELLAKIGVGESVTKVNVASIGGVSFPSEDEIDQLFKQSVETIIDRMCALSSNRRPADMTTSFTVGVSVVMQASILVSARWETANVCL